MVRLFGIVALVGLDLAEHGGHACDFGGMKSGIADGAVPRPPFLDRLQSGAPSSTAALT